MAPRRTRTENLALTMLARDGMIVETGNESWRFKHRA